MENRNYKVYMHTNMINGKKYIGITKQKPSRRWRNNGYGYKNQAHFCRAIKKYGWDNFKHEILFDNLTLEEANAIEKCYVKNMDLMNPVKGYNGKEGGDCAKPSEDAKRRMSEAHKGCKHSEETKEKLRKISTGRKLPKNVVLKLKQRVGDKNPMYGKGKSVICLETKEIFNSARIAGDKLNIEASSIASNCRGKRKSAGGLHFCYLKNYDNNKEYDLKLLKKKVICIETGEIFTSIKEASKIIGVSRSSISSVCRGKTKTTKGLHFKFYLDKN